MLILANSGSDGSVSQASVDEAAGRSWGSGEGSGQEQTRLVVVEQIPDPVIVRLASCLVSNRIHDSHGFEAVGEVLPFPGDQPIQRRSPQHPRFPGVSAESPHDPSP